MKRVVTLITGMILLLISVPCSYGISRISLPNRITGCWEFVKYMVDDEDKTENIVHDLPAYAYGQLEIRKNGTASMTVSYIESDKSVNHTVTDLVWEINSDNIAVINEVYDEDFEGEEEGYDNMLAIPRGDTLILQEDWGDETDYLYYEKVKKFHKLKALEITKSDFYGRWAYIDDTVSFDDEDDSLSFILEINKNHKCTMSYYGNEDEASDFGDFIVNDDGTFAIDTGYEVCPLKIRGSILIMESDGSEDEFRKLK